MARKGTESTPVAITDVGAPTKSRWWFWKSPRPKDYDDIYARRMYALFGGRGHALRRAEPGRIFGPRIQELLIGDVCFLDRGVPNRLYNIIWPDWDTNRAPLEIPSFRETYESFYTDVIPDFPEPYPSLCRGDHWASETTSRKNNVNIHADVPPAPGFSVQVNAEFSSRKGEGALLHLQEQSFSQSIGSNDYLRDYLIAHGAAIYDWVVRTRNLKRLKMEDLIFVTGHEKTSAWATWAHREISGSHSFSCTGTGASCLGVGVQHSRSHTLSESPAHACGPTPFTRLLRASPAPSKKGKKGKQPAANTSGPQTSSRSLESAIVRQNGMELAELRQRLHMSDDVVPPEQASILPNQCLLVEGFRMQQRSSLFPRRAPKGIPLTATDASEAPEYQGSSSIQMGPSESSASSIPANQDTGTILGEAQSNHRSHVSDEAVGGPLESDFEVVTLGDSDQYAAPRDGLDHLLDYILSKEPDVQCAVAHPYDLLELFEDVEDIPEDLEPALLMMSPPVGNVNGVGSLMLRSEAQATKSWWKTHRTEIIAGVRQVLKSTKEALGGVPVYGPAAAVAPLGNVLEIFQAKWNNAEALIELSATLKHVVDIVSRYDGSGPPRTDRSGIPAQSLARVARFENALDAIRKEWVDHDAKGHVRQLLTSEHIDVEIQDLNREISSTIQHILLNGHSNSVTSASFSESDGRQIVSGSGDPSSRATSTQMSYPSYGAPPRHSSSGLHASNSISSQHSGHSHRTPYQAAPQTSRAPHRYTASTYGAPSGADPQLWSRFAAVDSDRSGSISVRELQEALRNRDWQRFDLNTIKMLMNIFDVDRSGTIGFNEFTGLWQYIADWHGVFRYFDRDDSGSIEGQELRAALAQCGYNLSPGSLQLVVQKFASNATEGYATVPGISFDGFVQACVVIKHLTEEFQKLDTDQDGWVQIDYERFMGIVLTAPYPAISSRGSVEQSRRSSAMHPPMLRDLAPRSGGSRFHNQQSLGRDPYPAEVVPEIGASSGSQFQLNTQLNKGASFFGVPAGGRA